MQKIAINVGRGECGLCYAGVCEYAALTGKSVASLTGKSVASVSVRIPRDDPALVAVIEKLGEKAGIPGTRLKVVEIPPDVKWRIVASPNGGLEWVEEIPRTWS